MTPPDWLRPLLAAVGTAPVERFARYAPPAGADGRQSAVLVLFGEGPDGPDLLFIERSADLRRHAGQPAFPGGAVDPADTGPEAAALREAQEETGLDPAGVEVLATLPPLWLPPSQFIVVPVIAWWQRPVAVVPFDRGEVARVERIPVADLADPANRVMLRHPSGFYAPAFDVGSLLIWGFTAQVVDGLLALGGWERCWDHTRIVDLPPDAVQAARRDRERAGLGGGEPPP